MAIRSLNYSPPIRRTTRPPRPDYELLEAAVALAEEGRAVESVAKVFEHLFPSVAVPDLAAEGFSYTQGSSRVTARIEGDELRVTIPMVRLPTGGGAIAAMRFVLTSVSGSGQLHQPRLRGDDLFLEFRDKLSRLHPAKLVEVLRRTPLDADRFDDWLIGQFSALPLERAAIEALTDDEGRRCEAIWREHWGDVEALVEESQKKRSIFFLNSLSVYALFRVYFALPSSGFLGARLSERASVFNNGEEDPTRREATLAKCAKEMKAVSSDELRRHFGHAVYAFSPLSDGTPAVLSGYFDGGPYIEQLDELRKAGKSADAALGLFGTFNFLLAQYSWPEEVETDLKIGLVTASGKPWREAANALFEHAKAIAARHGSDADGGDDADDGDNGEKGVEA